MPIYRVTRKSDGAEVYRYAADAPIEWDGFPFADHDHTPIAEPPAPPAVHAPVRITRLAFRQRFTASEKTAIEIAAQHNPSLAPNHQSNLLAASLRASMADQRDAQHIDLSRADTRAGVLSLEQFGILAPGRAAVILDTPPTDVEVWNG